MIIKIQLFDKSFTELDTDNIEAINDIDGSCVIKTGSGQSLLTFDSYVEVVKLLGNFINIKN